MTPHGPIGIGVLLLLLGTVAPAHARQDQPTQDPRPSTQAQQPEAGRPKQVAVSRRPTLRMRWDAALPTPLRNALGDEEWSMWEHARAHSWQAQHHTWEQRGGYDGARIPDAEFREHYGRGHTFRIHTLPSELVAGHVRFQYGRYWFALIDPWPEFWPDTWYKTDDVYINYYGEGYYLFNESRPGVRVAVQVIPD
jgi:hypothetical protein